MSIELCSIPLREVLHFLGWRGTPVDEPTLTAISEMTDLALREIEPRVAYIRKKILSGFALEGTAMIPAGKAVQEMVAAYGCKPENIRAAIGPNIGVCCFETHRDVPDAMIAALGTDAEPYIHPHGEKYYVNLKEINALWLRKAGVQKIEISTDCTACQTDRFWSHRIVGDARGSQGAIIVCKEVSQ